MTLAFLHLSPDERKVYIEEAAARRGVSPVIVEKDFWVSWLLGIVFGASCRDAIVFKGGTSLSKVFGVINRFSEDIKLVPPSHRETALRRDYQAMRDMYLSDPLPFERILSTLADMERQINGVAGGR